MGTTIFIEIKGGMITSISTNTEKVNIKILDRDLIDEEPEEENYIPDSIMTDEGLNEYMEREYAKVFQNNFKFQ